MVKKINIKNKNYPDLLRKISDPPKELKYKGNWDDDLFENCLAVVGTRRITKQGKQVVKKIVEEVAMNGITIVSGFMFGVDAEAHRATVRVNERTIAVMPCGINIVHPAHQEDLYKEILKKRGLIISEMPDDQQALKWTYPRRNRIVAGLSRVVLIVEGTKRSGTLITARFAKKYKRILTATPGSIMSDKSYAPNELIKHGARVVTEAKDILKLFNIKNKRLKKIKNKESKILSLIKSEPLTIDEISLKTKKDIKDLNVVLSELEIDGKIKEESGKYYVN
ncbi:MAG: DNA-processing protein DprA [Candidatus Paceibacterota bacterium]